MSQKVVREINLVQATVQHCARLSVSTQHRVTAGFSTVCSSGQKPINKLLWTSQNETVKTLKTFAYWFAVEKKDRLSRLFWIHYLQFSRQFLSSCSKLIRLHIHMLHIWALRNRNILAYCVLQPSELIRSSDSIYGLNWKATRAMRMFYLHKCAASGWSVMSNFAYKHKESSMLCCKSCNASFLPNWSAERFMFNLIFLDMNVVRSQEA